MEETKPFSEFLGRLEHSLDAPFAGLFIEKAIPTGKGRTHFISPAVRRSRRYRKQILNQIGGHPDLDQPPGRVFTLREIAGRRYEAHPYFREFLAPNGFEDVLAVNVGRRRHVAGRLLVARDGHRPPFDASNRALVSALAPYLSRTIGVYSRLAYLEAKGRLYDELVSRVGIGEIRLNGNGEVVYTNQLAESLLADGHLLRRVGNRLQAHDTDDTRRLNQVIDLFLDSDSTPKPEPVYLRSSEPIDIVGLIFRKLPVLNYERDPQQPVLSVYIGDHTRRLSAGQELVQKLFGLTRAEARVAVDLAQGLTTHEIASRRHVSRNTVRSHISQIYHKAGVSRQSTLTNLLVRTLAAMWSEFSND